MNPISSNAIVTIKILYRTFLFALAISSIGLQPAIAEDSKTMKKDSKIQTSHEFDLPAAAVWNLIAGFNTLPDYHAAVPASRLTHGELAGATTPEEIDGLSMVPSLFAFELAIGALPIVHRITASKTAMQ